MAGDPLVRETQKLYGLPLSQFTAARNARAKELKNKGDAELAAVVAALPKPSVAAGALDEEPVDEDPSEVRALVQSGKRLRQAQEAAVAGKKGADLNEAIQEHRVALDRVQRDLRRRKLSAADGRQSDADLARRLPRSGALAAARARAAARGSDVVRLRHRSRGLIPRGRPRSAPLRKKRRQRWTSGPRSAGAAPNGRWTRRRRHSWMLDDAPSVRCRTSSRRRPMSRAPAAALDKLDD